MSIAENIKRIRIEKGISQKRLGELCNIAEPNIRKYENGKQNPKLQTLIKIAKALGVHLKDLVDNSVWDEFDKTIDTEALAKEVKAIEVKAIKDKPFILFLNSCGYAVSLEKDEFYLTKDGITTIFTEEEFDNFQLQTKQSVDYQFWLKRQNKK